MKTNIENTGCNPCEEYEKERKEYEDNIRSLIPKFKKLNSFQEKLDFRDEHKHLITAEKVALSEEDMANGNCLDFTPNNNNKEEVELYNKWKIKQIKESLARMHTSENRLPFVTLEDLIKDFYERKEKVKLKEKFVESEIQRVKTLFDYYRNDRNGTLNRRINNNYNKTRSDTFNELYSKKINGRQRDLTKPLNDNIGDELLVEPYVDYLIFLEEGETKLIPDEAGEVKLTRNTTCILFYFLRKQGIIKKLDNLPLAKELENLTGFKQEQTRKILSESEIEAILSKPNKNKTKANLESLVNELEIIKTFIQNHINSIGD